MSKIDMYKCYKCAINETCKVFKMFNSIAMEQMNDKLSCSDYEPRGCWNCKQSSKKITESPCDRCNIFLMNGAQKYE